MTIQMTAIEQYFHVVLLVNNAGKKVLTFKSVNETLVRNYSHESLSISITNSYLLPSFPPFFFQQLFLNASSHLLDLKNKQEWINAQKVSTSLISFRFLLHV